MDGKSSKASLIEARKKFLAAAERQGWAGAEGVVCALSGGGDSVATLWMLREFFNGRVVAAHLDHCTREGESHCDAEFARELCRGWGIECAVKVVDVHETREKGESFEMAAARATSISKRRRAVTDCRSSRSGTTPMTWWRRSF